MTGKNAAAYLVSAIKSVMSLPPGSAASLVGTDRDVSDERLGPEADPHRAADSGSLHHHAILRTGDISSLDEAHLG
jgi:hypothetical protein